MNNSITSNILSIWSNKARWLVKNFHLSKSLSSAIIMTRQWRAVCMHKIMWDVNARCEWKTVEALQSEMRLMSRIGKKCEESSSLSERLLAIDGHVSDREFLIVHSHPLTLTLYRIVHNQAMKREMPDEHALDRSISFSSHTSLHRSIIHATNIFPHESQERYLQSWLIEKNISLRHIAKKNFQIT